MKRVFILLIMLIFLTGCTRQETNITLSDRENPQEGLNIFNVSQESGVIEGAYLEGEYRIDFEARRGEVRPLLSIILEPQMGWYDVSACYISKDKDPFIVADYCSIPPLCPPEADQDSEQCQINGTIRTKEFQLAEKTATELKNMSFPKSLQREVDVLSESANILELSSFPASSVPNN